MNVQEAAERLMLSERHVYRLMKTGVLPAKKVKKKIEVEINVWESQMMWFRLPMTH
jgi:excisionase family DNA binding protein